ncbi:MAG: patatin-like phospholipase family protein [Sandaracinaceae bacterium]|jgi:predicted acylesterase/phospholipase RssA|nr:patatin-like phospholipase family protein [Sandaracinaceae bacterium]MBP7683664.1 patatin-like phospholipase family protein [Deltaproteobacteria bacterium]MBK6813752.1 patatin-like phospholipase family protein [Sandaracinaceae bacterium]MBK7154744.1 patatin-like phospholipase family protein [Sandaracinaceae bacterium]MBK7776877.1 patatin-like phospholipase family protein [Sandaracinaceae bacterium]
MSSADVETLLTLQRMESKLVDALFEHPGTISRRREHELRYAVSFAGLHRFQPGAAAKGGRTQRRDVPVQIPALDDYRRMVVGVLSRPLLHTRDSEKRLRETNRAYETIAHRVGATRRAVLDAHANDFSAQELDDEVGIKTLVSIAGGGGGAGYVYIGAWEVMQHARLIPGYIIGSSIGAVLGLFRAKEREGDYAAHLERAKQLRRDEVFRFISMRARYGLPGIFRLYLHHGLQDGFRNPDGSPMRLSDLQIPFEAVVGGVRRGALEESPEAYAISHHLPQDRRPGRLELRARLATQMVRMWSFVNPRVVKEIVIGGDALTADFDAIDAAGFSAAIPGILHYDIARDAPSMHSIASALMEREEIDAMVDGGVANNVPARTAWRQVHAGKIGTRNCYYLAFDCLSPQMSLGHAWMNLGERVLEMQVALNKRYMHRRVAFKPTLSPVTLLPNAKQMDQAVAWGRAQMSGEVTRIQKHMERVRYEEG